MPNNKLILRSVNSPWVTPFNDITKNTVLGWSDVDNNFIYLKGELIHSGYTNNNTLFLQKINGNTISVNLNITPSGTDVYVTGGTYSNGTLELLNNTGGTFNVNGFYTGSTDNYTTGATLNDTILSFDRTDALSAYTVDLSSLTSYGNQWFIPSGTTVEVKENYQSFIYGDLHIEGLLLLNDNAQLVVLNGDIILSGGSISGNGTTLLVNLPEFDTYITGGTYLNGDLILTDNFGADITVNGFYTGSTDTYVTGGTYFSGGTIVFNYNTGGDFEVSGLTIDLDSEIAGLAEADEQTITLNLDTNKIELKETIAEATGGTRTFQGDFAISGGTLNLDTIGSGSPVINLGLDSSGFVVTGTTSTPFTGNTSGDCISDLYVSNVHSCSPLHINPNDEGNIYFGSASGVTVDLANHKLVVENLQITSGATDGYILTSDASGNIGLTAPTDGFTYQIGQYVEEEGGVIFHSYKDGTNENYLVVAIDDQSTGTTWSNITNQLAGTDSTWNGLENSLTITGQTGHTESAAQLCLEYVNGGCDTILVTYQLEGEEPVTVEVEKNEDGNYYIEINNIEYVLKDGYTGGPQNPTWELENISTSDCMFYLDTEEDPDCPFGTYVLEDGGSIFESFSVAPVNYKDDWYLPAIDELSLLWQNRFNVNKTLSGNSSFGTILGADEINNKNYWSSTEKEVTNIFPPFNITGFVWMFNFGSNITGSYNTTDKSNLEAVRAVRKFSI
jgi:hypothetical protein